MAREGFHQERHDFGRFDPHALASYLKDVHFDRLSLLMQLQDAVQALQAAIASERVVSVGSERLPALSVERAFAKVEAIAGLFRAHSSAYPGRGEALKELVSRHSDSPGYQAGAGHVSSGDGKVSIAFLALYNEAKRLYAEARDNPTQKVQPRRRLLN